MHVFVFGESIELTFDGDGRFRGRPGPGGDRSPSILGGAYSTVESPNEPDCVVPIDLTVSVAGAGMLVLEAYVERFGMVTDLNYDGASIILQDGNEFRRVLYLRVPGNGELSRVGFRVLSCPEQFEVTFRMTTATACAAPTHRSARELEGIYRGYLGSSNWWSEQFMLTLHGVCEKLFSYALRSGGSALDLGCNRGVHLVELANFAGPNQRVVGVDANIAMLDMAREALGPNADRVELVHLAVVPTFSSKETVTFYVSDEWIELGSLDRRNVSSKFDNEQNSSVMSIEVPCMTVDQLIARMRLDNLSFVKIDVEGVDLAIILGASRLFESKPILYFEYSRTQGYSTTAQSYEKLARLGYRLFDCFMNELDRWTFVHPALCPIDRIAIPAYTPDSDIAFLRRELTSMFANEVH